MRNQDFFDHTTEGIRDTHQEKELSKIQEQHWLWMPP
jgi:hypothetical protein